MSTARLPSSDAVPVRRRDVGLIVWLVVGAVAVGVLAAFSAEVALGTAVVVAVTLLFLRSAYKSEIIVGLYWLAFCVYETIVSGLSITGFFYPFYAAFLVSIVAAVVGSGIRARNSFFWLLVGFLLVVAASFVGFMQPIGFNVIQRVLAYLIGAAVFLQFRSRGGLVVVAAAAGFTSLALATWVVISAVQGGFAYRGDVSVNENVVAFYVGLGFVVMVAATLRTLGAPGRRWLGVGLLVLTGGAAYALLLLASRGMAIAAGLALVALIVRIGLQDWRRLLPVLALLAVSGAGMLLPGGEGLVQRFTSERVESGGSRTPIWQVVYDGYRDGNLMELALGNGFESSEDVVERGFGTLTSTHNAYLEVLYEFGIVGLALFLALHLAPIVVSWRVRGTLGLVMYGLAFFLLGADVTSTAPDGFLYWTALAFVLAIGTWAPNAATPRTGPQSGAAASRGQKAPT
ncbi:MAG: O-antigen ligase family protein [Trueperaceae bacterium]|nr:O-antigen ligase family protein [Trueperaceae bacterium]